MYHRITMNPITGNASNIKTIRIKSISCGPINNIMSSPNLAIFKRHEALLDRLQALLDSLQAVVPPAVPEPVENYERESDQEQASTKIIAINNSSSRAILTP